MSTSEKLRWSRRAVLGASAAAAGAAVLPQLGGPSIPLFVSAKPSLVAAGAKLAAAVERSLLALGDSRRVEVVTIASRRAVPMVVEGLSSQVLLSFGGPTLDGEVAAAALGRTHIQLSFGGRLESARRQLELSSSLEVGGAWAAKYFGARAAIVSTGPESAYDTAFAFRRGIEEGGGAVEATHVIQGESEFEEALKSTRADVVLALASGRDRAPLWRAVSHTQVGSRLVVDPFALSPEAAGSGATLISSWGLEDAYDALGRRAALQLLGRPSALPHEVTAWSLRSRVPELILSLGLIDDRVTSSTHLSSALLRSGSSEPYTGC